MLATLDVALYVPLESEGMSRVMFESLAAGRPLIAARVGLVPEILRDREHALLVPGGDVPALRAALAELLGDGGVAPSAGRGRARPQSLERYPGARLAEALERTVRAAGRGVKVTVVAFDLSDNATGRADLLARLLAPRYDVRVVGPRFGAEIWGPARGGRVPYRAVAGGSIPGFACRVSALLELIDGDVIYASKLRPTSYGLGLLARSGAAGRSCWTSTTGSWASSIGPDPGGGSAGRSISAIPTGCPGRGSWSDWPGVRTP